MAYQIEYACVSHVGKVRANNEDNFWCCGKSLEADNYGTDGVFEERMPQRKLPLLAVFDGMGGESCGEIAASLASSSCGQYYKENRECFRRDPENFLQESLRNMNRAVCAYGKENRIRSMGTTAAAMLFAKDTVYAANLGDSRIYRLRQGQFKQISTDHVVRSGMFGKAPLTQYVGVPEEMMELEPSILCEEAEPGTRYLLCSDGVTDMLSDGEIADILSRDIPVREAVAVLLERALLKGGRDNITIVLCEILEPEKQNCFFRWFRSLGTGRERVMQDEKPDAGSGL